MIRKFGKTIPLLFLALVFVLPNFAYAAAAEINFDLNPKTVAQTSQFQADFQMRLRVTINVDEFNSECGRDANSFAWFVYWDTTGSDVKKAQGTTQINRTQPTLSFNLDERIRVNLDPSEFLGGSSNYYGAISCSNAWVYNLTESDRIPIIFGSATDKNYACVAANNKYNCSPSNLSNCSDVSDCSRGPCREIGSNLCGEDAGTGPLPPPGGGTCNNNGRCDSGETSASCSRDCPIKPGETVPFIFKLDNPLQADNLLELIDVLATWLFNLSIPIVVIMIVYAGVMFLTSRGDTTKVTKARQILLYAVVGFAIILIGKGFITLIESVLNLGTGSSQQQQQQQQRPGGGQSTFPITGGIACENGSDCPLGFSCDTTSEGRQVINGQTFGTCFASSRGDIGSSCSRGEDCFDGLICNSICQRPSGNLQGEPCAGGGTCAENRGCDASGENVQVIGGRNLGTCR